MDSRCIIGTLLFLFLNLSSLLPSSACPYCPYPIPSPPPPHKKPLCPPPPTKPKSPAPPPKPKHSPPPPKFSPPPPPIFSPPPPPIYSPPPPPPKQSPPPPSPKFSPPPPPILSPPPPPIYSPPPVVPCPPPAAPNCPINTLKLDACVDLLGGLVHIGIGSGATGACCPVLAGLADLDAALCLCTTIKAKVLNINILLPIALELLLDCGKHLPSDYQCPS